MHYVEEAWRHSRFVIKSPTSACQKGKLRWVVGHPCFHVSILLASSPRQSMPRISLCRLLPAKCPVLTLPARSHPGPAFGERRPNTETGDPQIKNQRSQSPGASRPVIEGVGVFKWERTKGGVWFCCNVRNRRGGAAGQRGQLRYMYRFGTSTSTCYLYFHALRPGLRRMLLRTGAPRLGTSPHSTGRSLVYQRFSRTEDRADHRPQKQGGRGNARRPR